MHELKSEGYVMHPNFMHSPEELHEGEAWLLAKTS